MVNRTGWTQVNSDRAREIWADYSRRHDVAGNVGKTVGIDPANGAMWFGDSIQDVIAQRDAAGTAVPLFFIRVGSETYYR